MGGFLGIGTSSAEKALQAQKAQAAEEAERARRDAEIALAERSAKKGQETANIQLGKEEEVEKESQEETTSLVPKTPSSSLGLGGISNKKGKSTGVQL